MLLPIDAPNKSRQIKIILTEQNSHRFHHPVTEGSIHFPVANMQHPLLLHRGSQLPERLNEPAAVVRLHIVESLVANQCLHLLQMRSRCAALDELIQNREHLFLHHGAALQQNFTHRQHLTVGQGGGLLPGKAISPGARIIQHLPAIPPFRKKGFQIIQITLNAFFCHPETGSPLLFIDHPAAQQLLLQSQQTVLFAGNLCIAHAIPSKIK